MRRVLTGTIIFTLFVGILAISLYKILGINITYLTYNQEIGTGMYIYDFSAYAKGLENTFNSLNNATLLAEPPVIVLHWDTVTNSFKSIGNIFVYAINMLIFVFNALFVVIKIIFYVIICIMALFGLNTEEIWLYKASVLLYNINIPYLNGIPY